MTGFMTVVRFLIVILLLYVVSLFGPSISFRADIADSKLSQHSSEFKSLNKSVKEYKL